VGCEDVSSPGYDSQRHHERMAYGLDPVTRHLLYDPLNTSIWQELRKFMSMVFAVLDAFIWNEGLVDLCNWVGMWTRLLCLFHLF
jgi:hypothetical protein